MTKQGWELVINTSDTVCQRLKTNKQKKKKKKKQQQKKNKKKKKKKKKKQQQKNKNNGVYGKLNSLSTVKRRHW